MTIMTIAFTARRTVPSPPGLVWATLTDWARAPEWMPGVSSMRDDGTLRVGTILHFVAREKEGRSIVTSLEPGRALTLTNEQPGVRADYAYELAAEGAGTVISLTADVATSGAMRLLGPVIRRSIAAADGVQLDRLAALL